MSPNNGTQHPPMDSMAQTIPKYPKTGFFEKEEDTTWLILPRGLWICTVTSRGRVDCMRQIHTLKKLGYGNKIFYSANNFFCPLVDSHASEQPHTV